MAALTIFAREPLALSFERYWVSKQSTCINIVRKWGLLIEAKDGPARAGQGDQMDARP